MRQICFDVLSLIDYSTVDLSVFDTSASAPADPKRQSGTRSNRFVIEVGR